MRLTGFEEEEYSSFLVRMEISQFKIKAQSLYISLSFFKPLTHNCYSDVIYMPQTSMCQDIAKLWTHPSKLCLWPLLINLMIYFL